MAAHFGRAEADRTEVVVTRQDHEPMVVLALSEWQAVLETMHVRSTPANAGHFRRPVKSQQEGRVIERDLVEP